LAVGELLLRHPANRRPGVASGPMIHSPRFCGSANVGHYTDTNTGQRMRPVNDNRVSASKQTMRP
jgi:hypothetical protein